MVGLVPLLIIVLVLVIYLTVDCFLFPAPLPASPTERKPCCYDAGDPHIGHAYEAITSDVLSRYQRMSGKRVFFQTGSDEHGQKIANTASALGVEPIDICDKYAGETYQGIDVYIGQLKLALAQGGKTK